ncbi:VanZ family protein [Streptomyces sp. 4N509B]|uniref:VanZ family protein n=1 Tax=Streptomyces sp. 4N509B TaxID=3457413 RepID=UPI003FD3012D
MAALVLLAVHLALVGWLSLRPLSVLWVSPANLEPFHTIRTDLDRGPVAALRGLAAGTLRLAPLGLLLPLLSRRLGGGRFASFCRTVAVGAVLALLIEFAQSLTSSRVADVDSAILNTLGVALTHLAGYGCLRAVILDDPARLRLRLRLRQGARLVGRRARGGGGTQPRGTVLHRRGLGRGQGRAGGPAAPAEHAEPGARGVRHARSRIRDRGRDRGRSAEWPTDSPGPVPAHNGAAPHAVRGAALSR